MKNKILKYSIIILILSILFFILFNIRKEDGIKENTTVEKVASKTNINRSDKDGKERNNDCQ